MHFVPLAPMSGTAAPGGPSVNSLALAGLIGCVGGSDFGSRALAQVNRMLPVCWWSLYRLHDQRAPELHVSGSFEARDRTAASFRIYRQGSTAATRASIRPRRCAPAARP